VGTLRDDQYTFMIISRLILLRMTNVSNKKMYRKSKHTHFMFNNSFRRSCRLWDNAEKYCRARQATDDNV